MIILISPINKENRINILSIIDYLEAHFNFNYKARGASILLVIAIYSLYEYITSQLKSFDKKYLDQLNSHTNSDVTGEIVVRNIDNREIYEVVKVKFGIPIDAVIINDAYKKFNKTRIQRYYILSTSPYSIDDKQEIDNIIYKIIQEHGWSGNYKWNL